MPHVEIRHFPAELSDSAKQRLATDIVEAVVRAFGVGESAVSIGLENIDKADWQERVYGPLIVNRPTTTTLLRKPGY